ncbi:hypothetical protein [Pseudophaeobacter sp.]|uniref:hypothetical protein n=1 Tax=Pseudophaeobacter sp. TaxID=1971739 RepID=UPI003299CCDA
MPRALPLMFLCASLAFTGLSGCSNEPELDDVLTPDLRDADYPTLKPIEDMVPLLPAPQEQSLELKENLEARSNSLERRAEALRRATN